MKTVTLEQMQIAADTHGGQLIDDRYTPSIIFFDEDGSEFGFEATENNDGEYYGFQFFGHTSKQALPHIIKCWNDLTEPAIVGDLLTIERAYQLIDKKIRVSYRNSSGGSIGFTIIVTGMIEKPSNQIGQKVEKELHFKMLEDDLDKDMVPTEKIYDFLYEWQGIFRATGSARQVFVDKIFE